MTPQRKWNQANPHKMREATSKWRKNNREKARAIARQWKKDNPAKHAAINMKRKAALLQRTVPWADYEKINQFYHEAATLTKETGESYVVDHIIPLQGEVVSGLHVHNNLQILTNTANCRKKNKFIPTILNNDDEVTQWLQST